MVDAIIKLGNSNLSFEFNRAKSFFDDEKKTRLNETFDFQCEKLGDLQKKAFEDNLMQV